MPDFTRTTLHGSELIFSVYKIGSDTVKVEVGQSFYDLIKLESNGYQMIKDELFAMIRKELKSK